MAIKNIIFDLGGVWLPIDERRTLAAFAALAAVDSPAAEAACAQGESSCKPNADENIVFDLLRRRRTSHERSEGNKPAASLEKPSNHVAVSEGSDRGETGAGSQEAAEAALADKRTTRCEAALRERSVRGGETAWSPRTGDGNQTGAGKRTGDGPVADATDKAVGSQAADLAARLQPDILAYELGEIDDRTLLGRLGRALRRAPDTPPASDQALTDAWNAMLLPFPEAHLPLLDAFGIGYRIFLLSNTNALHIRCVEQDFQRRFPGRKPFLQHFEKAYLSHELHLRKPQPKIYTHVLRDAGLNAGETLFVDDRAENIAAAAKLGIQTYHHPANAPLSKLPL